MPRRTRHDRGFSAGILLTLLVCAIMLLGVFFAGRAPNVPSSVQGVHRIEATMAQGNNSFDYLVIIVMENKNLNQIIGSSSAPYLNQLVHNYSLATGYTACDHPSLPNYMCLTGGNNYFSGLDCSPSGSCTTGNFSIVDRIESAGLTWRAYMEDMPSPCYKSAFGNYTFLTNPFIFYTRITGNSTRCAAHVVPANSGGKSLPDDSFVNALSSTTAASNYMWLTPNLCDNMHNCSISQGDNYLSKLVPLILDSYIFKTQKAALLITFDEGYGHYPTDYLYTVWAGPTVKTQYQSSIQYSHYSLPSTIETVWGLQPLATKDAGSPSMAEFFNPPPVSPAPLKASFTFSPANPDKDSTVIFTGSATGGTGPYNYTWFFGDGDKGRGQKIGYVYPVVGNYTANLTVTDVPGQATSTSQPISIDTHPPPAGICQGCTRATLPTTLRLMISFAVGVAIPLALSFAVSRKHRKIV